MTETRFYIELPADEEGNISMAPAVVEARMVHGVPDEWPGKNPDRTGMIPVAPPEMVERHVRWYEDAYGGWAETEGPARMLTREEYDTIIAAIPPVAQSSQSGY